MTNLFVSYSPKDKRYADPMFDMLKRLGFKPWIDPAPRPGQDWRFDIDEAIKASTGLLVIVTPNSAESVYVTYEWTYAIAHHVRVVPVIYVPARMHPRLESLERFDVTGFRDPAHFWDYFGREMHRIFPYKAGNAPIQSPMPATPPPMPVPVRPAPIDRSVMPPSRGYWLVMRRGPNLNMMWRFEGQTVTLGRDKSTDIPIEDAGVSRFHCTFTQFPEGYAVEDNNSTNGVIVNGNRIQGIVPLYAGMTLQFGDNILLTYEVVP
jgi:hypothetical protein